MILFSFCSPLDQEIGDFLFIQLFKEKKYANERYSTDFQLYRFNVKFFKENETVSIFQITKVKYDLLFLVIKMRREVGGGREGNNFCNTSTYMYMGPKKSLKVGSLNLVLKFTKGFFEKFCSGYQDSTHPPPPFRPPSPPWAQTGFSNKRLSHPKRAAIWAIYTHNTHWHVCVCQEKSQNSLILYICNFMYIYIHKYIIIYYIYIWQTL